MSTIVGTTGARLVVAVALLSSVAITGCGSDDTGDSVAPSSDPATAAPSPSAPGDDLSGDITVFAAASLTEAFTTLGEEFEASHPGVSVTLNFAASSGLATQITEGAPADVFASASQKTMDAVVDAGLAADDAVFATNSMEIAVPPDNPADITTLADLARPEVTLALCQEAVPCGTVARTVLGNAGLTVTPVTEEADVKAALTKVTLGEVDAAIVYRTDVLAAGTGVTGIEIADDVNAVTDYPIAALSAAGEPATAEAFVEYVLSPDGAAVLGGAGFGSP